MTTEHYRVVGLARPRARWFRDLSRWSTSAALPIDFVKCVAPEELTARLRSGRVFSAVILDAALPGIDRDLIDAAREAGAAVIIVSDGHTRRNWASLGVNAVLPDTIDRSLLLATLVDCAHPLAGPEFTFDPSPEPSEAAHRGRLVVVTGPSGGGASTLAIAAAQGLTITDSNGGQVVLADFALHADQALLHDAGDVIPGVQELVDAHRSGIPTSDDIRSLTFAVEGRGYNLLLGLRRHRDWTVLRPRAVHASLDGLLHAFRIVIADIEPDFEGDSEVGSTDVEDRNMLARSAALRADVAVVVGPPTIVGLRRMIMTIDELHRLGVESQRVLPVVTRAPRRGRVRAEIASAITELGRRSTTDLAVLPAPLFIADRRGIDDVAYAAGPLPRALTHPITDAISAWLDRVAPRMADSVSDPNPFDGVEVKPGTLGSWSAHEANG